jgi:hypothetical protein
MSLTELNQAAETLLPDAPMSNGRRKIVPPEGGKPRLYTRVTTFLKALDASDPEALIKYHGRYVAKGVVDDPELMQWILDHDPGVDKGEFNVRAERAAHKAGKNHKRDLGTAIHDAIALHLRGHDTPLDPEVAAGLAEYKRLARIHNIKIQLSEEILVIERFKISGRVDFIGTVGDDPELVVIDAKTGSIDYPTTMPAQVYLYATADTLFSPQTETHTPMPKVSSTHGYILHIPSDGTPGGLHRVDLTGMEELCQYAQALRTWRSQAKKRFTLVENPLARQEWIKNRLATIAKAHGTRRILREWDDHVGSGVPLPKDLGTNLWTDEQIDLIAHYCDLVEAGKEMPFGDSDPNIEIPQLPEPANTERTELHTAPEGGPGDPDLLSDLRNIMQADDNLKQLIAAWAGDAQRNRVDWMPGTRHLTERRCAIANAAVHCAQHLHDYTDNSTDVVRAAINTVTGKTYGLNVGTLLGLLTIEQANQLAQLAATGEMRIDATGAIRFVV